MSFRIFDVPDDNDADDKHISEVILGKVSEYVKYPSIYGKFGKVAEEKGIHKLPEGELVWGVSSRNYDEAEFATTPFDGKSFGALFLGRRGDGKSVELKNVAVDQIHARWGHYLVFFDPKQIDFLRLNRAMQEQKYIDILNKFGMKPRGYSVKHIIPQCLLFKGEEAPGKAQPFMLSAADFRTLDPQNQILDLLYLLKIPQNSASAEALQRVLTMFNDPRLRPKHLRVKMKPTEMFFRLVIHDIKNQSDERHTSQEEETDIKRRGGTNILYFKTKQLIESYVIGDPSGKNKINLTEELVNHGILNILTNLDETERTKSIYMKIIINKILSSIIKFRQGRGGIIDKPVIFNMDEADTLIPAEIRAHSPCRRTALDLLTRYRHYGCSLFMVTQNPAQIWSRVVDQCKYIITSKVSTEATATLLKIRGMPEYAIEEARKLYAGDEKPMEFMIVEPDTYDEPKRFFPLPSCTQFVKEGDIIGMD